MLGTFQQAPLGQPGWWCKSEGEGRKVEVPASLCRLSERAQGLCSVLLRSGCTGAGREGERMEPGGLSTGGRPGGDPLERRRCLSLLAMKSSRSAVCRAFGGYLSCRLGLAFLSLWAEGCFRELPFFLLN